MPISLKLGATVKNGFQIMKEHRKIHRSREKKFIFSMLHLYTITPMEEWKLHVFSEMVVLKFCYFSGKLALKKGIF